MTLTYKNYTKNRLAIYGEKELYEKQVKEIGGKWNPRMKGGVGWIIDIEKKVVNLNSP